VTRTPNPCTQRRTVGPRGETLELQGRLLSTIAAEERRRELEAERRQQREAWAREQAWRERRHADAAALRWHGWDADGAPVYGPPPEPPRRVSRGPVVSRGPAVLALLPMLALASLGVRR